MTVVKLWLQLPCEDMDIQSKRHQNTYGAHGVNMTALHLFEHQGMDVLKANNFQPGRGDYHAVLGSYVSVVAPKTEEEERVSEVFNSEVGYVVLAIYPGLAHCLVAAASLGGFAIPDEPHRPGVQTRGADRVRHDAGAPDELLCAGHAALPLEARQAFGPVHAARDWRRKRRRRRRRALVAAAEGIHEQLGYLRAGRPSRRSRLPRRASECHHRSQRTAVADRAGGAHRLLPRARRPAARWRRRRLGHARSHLPVRVHHAGANPRPRGRGGADAADNGRAAARLLVAAHRVFAALRRGLGARVHGQQDYARDCSDEVRGGGSGKSQRERQLELETLDTVETAMSRTLQTMYRAGVGLCVDVLGVAPRRADRCSSVYNAEGERGVLRPRRAFAVRLRLPSGAGRPRPARGPDAHLHAGRAPNGLGAHRLQRRALAAHRHVCGRAPRAVGAARQRH